MAAAARQLLGAAPRNNPPNNGGRLRPVIPRQPVLDRTKKATPKFARPSKPPQRLVELKKPPRMIDLYDTAELLHRSKTGTELVVGIHKLTGETVVIKAIEHSIYNQQAKKLLGAAVEKYAKLNHPHICQLYESFDSLRLLLVLEAVEGVSLSEFMVHVGCTPPEAQQIMRQTCAAIRYAHRAGVCHRDLRLENVMLQQGAQCCVKVIDWSQCGGVLKPLTRRLSLSPFCPPEARGPGEYDGMLVDVWALGVLLHVLLLGRHPFEGEGEAKGGAEGEAKGQAKGEAEGEASDTLGGGGQLRLEGLEASAAGLLRGMLAWQPSERMSMAEVRAYVRTWTHPWRWIGSGVGL